MGQCRDIWRHSRVLDLLRGRIDGERNDQEQLGKGMPRLGDADLIQPLDVPVGVRQLRFVMVEVADIHRVVDVRMVMLVCRQVAMDDRDVAGGL